MGQRNLEEQQQNNVRTIDNDFVRSNPNAKRAKRKAKKAVLLRRRLAVFFAVAIVLIAGLAKFQSMLDQRLAEKHEKKIAVTEQLEEVLSRQEMLNLQISKLEDDEYLAKLARKEFFLSEEGEIIFTIPKSSEANESAQDASGEQDEE